MEERKLDIDRQIKYWQRCLKSLLPTQYTSMDSARLMLGFLILSALDLLDTKIPASDIKAFRDWIISCQHPNGGFCGSPNHRYPDSYYDAGGHRQIESANLAATFFGLLSLNLVGNIADIQRSKCLKFLKRLQRDDGSFGEDLDNHGKVGGGMDMRYCYWASAVRWMLRGDIRSNSGEEYEDIDVDALVKHIQSGETYEGGIGETSEHESHGGYTYCAIASLAFLDRLPTSVTSQNGNISSKLAERVTGLTNLPETIRWLLSRQVAYSDKDGEEEDLGSSSELENHHIVSDEWHADKEVLVNVTSDEPLFVGFNGRPNKAADTCYCFWVSGSLEILGKSRLINQESSRRFLLSQAQHVAGGFSKEPGYPPDVYHSYLGLANLAMMGETGLKNFDPVLCVSIQAKEKLEKAMMGSLATSHSYWKHGYLFSTSQADPDYSKKIAADEGPPPDLMDILGKDDEQNSVKKEGNIPKLGLVRN